MAARVVDVSAEREDEAVRVLAGAFRRDPLMRYLYDDQAPDYAGRLRAMFAYQVAVFLREGWPLLGVTPRTRLAGVLALQPPELPRHADDLAARYQALVAKIGPEAARRVEQYAAVPNGRFPDVPMFYVAQIAVRPDAQGRGYAQRLLDEAHRRAAAHPTAAGVGLDTENPENVARYRRLGYHEVGRAQLAEGLSVWCMFRPSEPDRAAARGAGA